jgi:hypothetical protein
LHLPIRNGNVTLFIQGSNADGKNGNFTVTPPKRRGFFGDIANAAGNAVDDIGDAVGDVVDDAKGAVDDALNGE